MEDAGQMYIYVYTHYIYALGNSTSSQDGVKWTRLTLLTKTTEQTDCTIYWLSLYWTAVNEGT